MNRLAFDTNIVDAELMPSLFGPPYELLAEWRANEPIHWNPAPSPEEYRCVLANAQLTHGFWVITRHKDVFAVSHNQELFSSHVGGPVMWDLEPRGLAEQQAGLMGMLPPQHKQIRKAITPPFTKSALDTFEPEIERVVRNLIDGIVEEGRCEFVFDVGSKLPVHTFCTMLGVPREDWDMIFRLGNAAADAENEAANSTVPMSQLFAYSGKLAELKRTDPDDSLMTRMLQNDLDGEALTPDQIGMFFATFAIAGHETTRSTAAHFIRLMNLHPDQYELLCSDPDLYLPNAIEEVLRYAPPVINFRRTVVNDSEIAGQPVKQGEKIYMSYAAANRDPEIFDDPDRFDITRSNANRHLSFGTGPHVCLGARLARVQLRILMREIIERIPDIRMSEPPKMLRSVWMNAIINMPVEFTPRSRA